MNSLDMVAIYLPFKYFTFRVIKIPLLNQSVTFYHYKLLKYSIMPVLPLGNAWLGDVDAHLTCLRYVSTP